MKIGILTQPLHNNYGGLLQAYALQAILKQMGHEPWTVDLWSVESKKDLKYYYRLIKAIVKRFILRYFLRRPVTVNIWPTPEFKKTISQHTRRFINENIRTTEKISGPSKLPLLNQYNFAAYIVGSDQVWRPRYSPGLSHFFLDFLDDTGPVKRISYAASFGVQEWEYTPEQTEACGALAKMFDAISVREDSAISLCKEHFGVDAKLVLDPTLLLNVEDYIALVENDNIPKSKGDLLVYVIDNSTEKQKIIKSVAEGLGLEPFFVNKLTNSDNKAINDCIYPPVTQWLRGFMDTNFVITDSFHGTIFSILFNKPFISVGNEYRGMARFTSILKIFKLENQIIYSSQQITEGLLKTVINWEEVNAVVAEKKAEATLFLKDGLKVN